MIHSESIMHEQVPAIYYCQVHVIYLSLTWTQPLPEKHPDVKTLYVIVAAPAMYQLYDDPLFVIVESSRSGFKKRFGDFESKCDSCPKLVEVVCTNDSIDIARIVIIMQSRFQLCIMMACSFGDRLSSLRYITGSRMWLNVFSTLQ
jgi:hypothetical protein